MTENGQQHIPSDEERRLFSEFVAETNKRELSGSENFDKSLLTLSSAGLALSIGFLKDFAPISGASALWAIYFSWVLFTIATLSTMVSFLVSAKAQSYHREIAHRAYIQGDTSAFAAPNAWGAWTPRLNVFSAVAFTLALIFTIGFIISNLERIRAASSDKLVPVGTSEQRGISVPTMQGPAAPTSSPAPLSRSTPSPK